MYPNLYYAFRDLFGVEWSGLRFINSFGFFVALAFLVAAYILVKELQRKERGGLLQFSEVKVEVGKPASITDLAINFLLGFLLGYKFIGLFLTGKGEAVDPQEFIFSSKGNLPMGIAMAILFTGLKWWEKNKRKLAKPETRTVRLWPHDRVGDIVIYAALFGFLGAKIFHNLENWNEFIASPVEALLSFSGLTFYGGLICATLAIWWYARKHKINFKHLCDAAAPALMIAYAIGRIGCQVAGDGDWGILNSAYVITTDNKIVEAEPDTYKLQLTMNSRFYTNEFNETPLDRIPHKAVKAPFGLPVWMVAYTYPHNVLNHGVDIRDCTDGQYCRQLPVPVFPTPFYETLMALVLFFFLWLIRKKINQAGVLFSIYLIVNGIERFLIEKIRVNTTYDQLPFRPTQAELISSGLVILGLALFIYLRRKGQSAA